MLDNISFIASAISGLTAITTSLRALGRSREDDFPAGPAGMRLKGLLLHLLVTFIWFALSIIFAILPIRERLSSGEISIPILSAPFIVTVLICVIIWRKAVSSNG